MRTTTSSTTAATTTKIDPSKAIRQHLELLRNLGLKEVFVERVYPQQSDPSLDSLRAESAVCQKCPLHKGRIQSVFGDGDPAARVMLIGEAPGAEENQTGHPFVGAAGKLLDNILTAMHLSREEIYIANIVKCRPPGNRDPEPEEREACLPYLQQQIAIIQPKAILLMGLVASQTMLNCKNTLTQMRGGPHYIGAIPAFVTYHPAAMLRNPHWKVPAWEDLQKFMAFLDTL